MRKNKKAVELSLNTIIVAIILLVTLIVVIAVFIKFFGQETDQLGDYINSLDDGDDDGITNLFDRCPCESGTSEYKGCTSDKEVTEGYKKNIDGCSDDVAKALEK